MAKPVQIHALKLKSIALAHIFFAFAYAANIISYDVWRLLPGEALNQRWQLFGLLAIGSTLVWYVARNTDLKDMYYRMLVFALFVVDLVFAGMNVYYQRGIASKAVVFFVLPILVVTILANKASIFAGATVSTVVYILSVVMYANNNPSEGYKIELYGEIALYSLSLFIIAWVIRQVSKNRS